MVLCYYLLSYQKLIRFKNYIICKPLIWTAYHEGVVFMQPLKSIQILIFKYFEFCIELYLKFILIKYQRWLKK